jgi:hypothetical protein
MAPQLAFLPAAPRAFRASIGKPTTGGTRQVVAIPLNASYAVPGIAEVEVGLRASLVVLQWAIDDPTAAFGG